MVIQKPVKIPRKGLNSINEEAGLGSLIPLWLVYILPLISVAAVLVCLYLASSGSFCYQCRKVS